MVDVQTKKEPRLRFPGFRDEWKVKRFDEVFWIGAGGDISSEHTRKYKDKIFRYPIYANSEKSCGLYGYSDIYKEEASCVTVTGRGSLGIAVARHHPFYPIVRLLTLRLKQDGDIDFFENRINSIKFFVESTGVPQLTGPQIASYKITIPGSDEQESIAGFLGVVDDQIAALQNKKELLEKYKKGVMRAIFSQKIRFKVEDGGDYPAWQEKTFGSLFTFLRTNSLSRAELSDSGTIKNIHYGDIHTRLATNFDSSTETISFAPNLTGSDLCENGDLIIADASEDRKDVGKAIEIIKTNDDKIIAGLHTFLARPIADSIAIGFSGYLMQSQDMRKQIMRMANGASVLGVSKKELFKVVLNLPTKEEQQKIADFMTSIDDKINLTTKELEQANEFKKALLQQMFV